MQQQSGLHPMCQDVKQERVRALQDAGRNVIYPGIIAIILK